MSRMRERSNASVLLNEKMDQQKVTSRPGGVEQRLRRAASNVRVTAVSPVDVLTVGKAHSGEFPQPFLRLRERSSVRAPSN
jgi:hypothetical protein